MALLKTKKKYLGSEPTEYFSVVKETCERLRNIVNAVNSSMWQMGQILSESIEELDIKGDNLKISKFYEDIRKNLDVEVTTDFLSACIRFYKRYPDLQKRVEKTGLTATHYERLSHIPEREAVRYEKKASEEKWTVRDLRERAFERKVEIIQTEAIESYRDFSNSLTDLEDSLERLKKSKVQGVLSKAQIDGIARSLWIFVHSHLPRVVKWLEEQNAIIDPDFKKYVKKVSG